jgi:hypothetical protein
MIFNAILNQTPTSPVRLNPECPAELERITSKLLEKDSETLLKKEGIWPVVWSKDGKWIYANTEDNPQKILIIHVQGTQTKTLWTLPKDAWLSSMTSDGQRIVYSVSEWKSDVWLVEHFDPIF